MTITSMIVLFAVIWFLMLLIILPIGMRSQEEAGEVEPGTPASAPSDFQFKRIVTWTTVVTIVLWLITCGIIISGWISVDMMDFYNGISPRYESLSLLQSMK
ncbi:MAG: DUF1467 family protein [Pseudomonadota bacterium]